MNKENNERRAYIEAITMKLEHADIQKLRFILKFVARYIK